MDPRAFVVVADVHAVANGVALLCELGGGGRMFAVPPHLVAPDSEVRKPGDRGKLSIPRWVAQKHRLPTGA